MSTYLKPFSLLTTVLLLSLSLEVLPLRRSILAKTLDIDDCESAPYTHPKADRAEAAQMFQQGIQQFCTGKYLDALQTYERVLVIYRKRDKPSVVSDTLHQLGKVYAHLSQYERAWAALQEALAIRRQLDDFRGTGRTLNHLGFVARRLSKYDEALELHQQALEIAKQTDDRRGMGQALHNIGAIYSTWGNYDRALEFYQQALDLHRQIGARFERGRTLNNMGNAYYLSGDYLKANEAYQQAIDLARAIDNRAGEGRLLTNLGTLYRQRGNYFQAVLAYQQALAILDELGDRASVSDTFNSLGILYEYWGQYDTARDFYQQAFEIAQEINDTVGSANALSNIAYIREQQNQTELAIDIYKLAIEQFIEQIIVAQSSDESKASFLEQYLDIYTSLIDLLWNQGRFQEAFNYVERARARVFLHQIASRPSNFRANSALFKKEQELRNQVNNLNQQIMNLHSGFSSQSQTRKITSIKSELNTRKREYLQLLKQIKQHNPEFADLVSINPAQIKEIQSLLDQDTTLIEYFVTEKRTLAFLITKDNITSVTLDVSGQDLTEAVKALYEYDFATFQTIHPSSLQKLHQWLIAPLQNYLSTSKLGIVPHNILHYLPFAALTDGQQYLSARYALFSLPSASVMRFLQEKHKPDNQILMALGNPTLDLPYAQQEVETIATLYATQPLTNTKAMESIVWSQANQASILHLATHGEYNPINPLLSTLHLVEGNGHDGRLEIHEIYGLNLRRATNLVVLSACQTKIGKVSRGDEIVGLNRAFLYAGTPSIIASLWNIDDEASSLLMERFYIYLKEGKSKAEALQLAQKDTRVKYPHPYYWSAFVLTGL